MRAHSTYFKSLFIHLLLGVATILTAQDQETEEIPSFTEPETTLRSIHLSEKEGGHVIEWSIHRWGETESPKQTFAISVVEQPDFFNTLSIDKSNISFAQDEWEIPIRISFNTTPPEDSSKIQNLVLKITAEDETIVPTLRKIIIPFTHSSAIKEEDATAPNIPFFVRTTKEGFDYEYNDHDENIPQIHPDEVPLYTFDPVYICLDIKSADAKFGYYRIIAPDGVVFQTGENTSGASSYRSYLYKELEGAPTEVVIAMRNKFENVKTKDDEYAKRIAGKYSIEVAKSIPIHTENDIFGVPSSFEPDEFKKIGSYTLIEPVYKFKGVTTKVVAPHKLNTPPQLSPSSSGSPSGTIGFTFSYHDKDENQTHQVQTTLTYSTPDTIYIHEQTNQSEFSSQVIPISKDLGGVHLGLARGFYITESYEKLLVLDKYENSFEKPFGFSVLELVSDDRYSNTSKQSSHWMVGEQRWDQNKNLGWFMRSEGSIYAIIQSVQASVNSYNAGVIEIVYLYGAVPGKYSDEQLASMSNSEAGSGNDFAVDGSNSNGENGNDQSNGTIAAAGATAGPSGTGNGSTTSNSDSGSNSTTTTTTSSGSSGSSSSQDTQLAEAITNNDPALIPPNHPDVSRHIQAWISNAEPPINVEDGTNVEYSPWGVFHGPVRGGIITLNRDKPDGVGGLSSSEYLWTMRTKLDSIDHCVLEDYVMLMLQGSSLAQCQGRHKPAIVSNVVGKHIDDAEQELLSENLKPKYTAGPPATFKEQEGTVAKQYINPGTKLRKNATITLQIYSNYISKIPLPNFTGKTIDEAENKLKELNLTMKLIVGEAATTRAQEYTIQSQFPTRATEMNYGDTVTLAAYSEYIPKTTVPQLSGLTVDQAEQQLRSQSLKMGLQLGEPASSINKENTVQLQSPPVGTTIKSGETVLITVFGKYVPPPKPRIEYVTTPDVVGINPSQALQKIRNAGLTPKHALSGSTYEDRTANIVASQYPTGNSRIQKGSTVTIYTPKKIKRPNQGLAFLPPVQKIILPSQPQIGSSFDYTIKRRGHFDQRHNNKFHRLEYFSPGDRVIIYIAWLEKGDSFANDPNFTPMAYDNVQQLYNLNLFEKTNEARTYKFSKKGIPASIIIGVNDYWLNNATQSYCQEIADDFFNQLIGKPGKLSSPVKSTQVTPSRTYLSPVQQLNFPSSIHGYTSMIGSTNLTRQGTQNWKQYNPTNSRTAMIMYGKGQFMENFFDEENTSITYLLIIVNWLEKGDSFTSKDQAQPEYKDNVITQTGPDIFLDNKQEAVAYIFSKTNTPASVMIMTRKDTSKAFCQQLADEMFKQLNRQ